MTRARFIVVGECAVKWVLPRREFDGNVIAPVRTIWIVKTTIVFRPLFAPSSLSDSARDYFRLDVRRSKRQLLRYSFSKDTVAQAQKVQALPSGDCGWIHPKGTIARWFSDAGLAVFSDRFDLSGKGGIKGKKIAKEKRPSEQRLSITFSIASNLEIAWIAVKIYFTDRDVECENQVQSNVCGVAEHR
jgi:hypothetical protein